MQLFESSFHAAELLYTSLLHTRLGGDGLPSDMDNSAAVILNPVGLSLWISMLAKVVPFVLGPKMRTRPGQDNNEQKRAR